MQSDEIRYKLKQQILSVQTETDFFTAALGVFDYQRAHCGVYAKWLSLLGRTDIKPNAIEDIPCVPIGVFKWFSVKSGDFKPITTYKSSGTTGQQSSKHEIRDLDLYQQVARKTFQKTYGALKDYAILALLPNYIERGESSLVAMTQDFIEHCGYPTESGFYLYDLPKLVAEAQKLHDLGAKVLIIGVSFALLDLAALRPNLPPDTIVIETGGMKGRRRELTRQELHDQLTDGLGLTVIGSEYGMTELLSQAYAPEHGLFAPTQTMQIRVRDLTDPFAYMPAGRSGAINIYDLANLDSCAFLGTDDLGIRHSDGRFEVLGRIDHSDMRGCNLLIRNDLQDF
jgi:hypothetical protein